MCHQKWTTTTHRKPKSLTQTPPQEHVTTSTLPETAPSPSPPVFFSGLPELRGAWAPTSPILLPSTFSSLSVLFALRAWAMACSSEGQRTRPFERGRCQGGPGLGELWDAPAPVGEPKVTTELGWCRLYDDTWVFLAWLRQDSFKLWQGNK